MKPNTWKVQGRNGYYGVDEYDPDGKMLRNTICVDKRKDAESIAGACSNAFHAGAETMRLEIMGLIPEKERAKVAFAIRWGLSRANVKRLLSLAKVAFVSQERAMSDNRTGLPEFACQSQARFEKYASDVCGFSVTWPGLNPALARDGFENILLPE